jgi:hypothetical protein
MFDFDQSLLVAGLLLRATSVWLRNTVGVAIIIVGIVSAGVTPANFVAWCRSGL